ncbi:MAG TPA: hypothetical protein EYM57_04370 [Gammaproteobacteria bacterium]|nr:hypothetical protein [Gammaproteobacteria bacterium]
MKKRSFVIDKSLYEVISSIKGTTFTTQELRDLFASRLKHDGIKGVPLAQIRLYVYEHIRRMVKVGWVIPAEEQKKRGQVYHLQPVPDALQLEFIAGQFHQELAADESAEMNTSSDDRSVNQGYIQSLQSQLKELELDMLSSMGEVERYKFLITEMPELSVQLEESLISAREKSSKLVGHFRAVENTLQILKAS